MATDTERLNWLETHDIEVRVPLRYGTRHLFFAYASQHDAEADHDSPLRAKIDAALEHSSKGGENG